MPGILNVYALPKLVEPEELAGGSAVVIDVLRSTTTIVHALAAGAREVIPSRRSSRPAGSPASSRGPGCARRRTGRSGRDGVRSGQLAGRLHGRSAPRQDAGHHHDQRHSGDGPCKNGDADFPRGLRQRLCASANDCKGARRSTFSAQAPTANSATMTPFWPGCWSIVGSAATAWAIGSTPRP